MANQDSYAINSVTENTVILGFESDNPKRTRNYSASEVGGFTLWGEIQGNIQDQIDLIALISGMTGENISNADLTFDANHLVDMAGYSWGLFNIKNVIMEANSAPVLGGASFEWLGYGNTASDYTHIFSTGAGDAVRVYGDLYKEFYGKSYFDSEIGVGSTPVSGVGVYASGSFAIGGYFVGSSEGVYGISTNGFGGRFSSVNNVGGYFESVNNDGGEFHASTAGYYGGRFIGNSAAGGVLGYGSIGVRAQAAPNGYAFRADGQSYIEDVGIGGAPNASTLLELNSTTKGFAPPRMTGTQAEAISSPLESLLVYATDGSGSVITSKGWWGYDGSTWVKLN